MYRIEKSNNTALTKWFNSPPIVLAINSAAIETLKHSSSQFRPRIDRSILPTLSGQKSGFRRNLKARRRHSKGTWAPTTTTTRSAAAAAGGEAACMKNAIQLGKFIFMQDASSDDVQDLVKWHLMGVEWGTEDHIWDLLFSAARILHSLTLCRIDASASLCLAFWLRKIHRRCAAAAGNPSPSRSREMELESDAQVTSAKASSGGHNWLIIFVLRIDSRVNVLVWLS